VAYIVEAVVCGKGLPLKQALNYYAHRYAHRSNIIGGDGKKFLSEYMWLDYLDRLPRNHPQKLTGDLKRELESYKRFYIERIVARLRLGILVARGFMPNSLSFVCIPPEWWTSVRLDIENNTAQANGVTISGILIFSPTGPETGAAAAPSAAERAPAATGAAATKRRPTGRDYRPDDAPLVAEMRAMIEANEARSVTGAAREVEPRAAGSRTARSCASPSATARPMAPSPEIRASPCRVYQDLRACVGPQSAMRRPGACSGERGCHTQQDRRRWPTWIGRAASLPNQVLKPKRTKRRK
jgi:hypothetical protein